MDSRQINHSLSIRNGHLYIEDCDTVELAERFGTPLFVVSESHLAHNFRRYQQAFEKQWPEGSVRIMAAIKANPITAVRRVLTREGAGCDTFGLGELEAALRGGVPPHDISVNGSIKSRDVIRRAIEVGAHIILDNPIELEYCEEEAAKLGKTVPVLLRVKPYLEDLDEPSDFYPSRTIREMTQTVKYGIPTSEMLPIGPRAMELPHVELIGVHTHSGRHSKKLEFWRSLVRAYVKVIVLIRDRISQEMGGTWVPKVVSFGGGFASDSDRETRVAVTDYATPTVDDYAEAITSTFRQEMVANDLDPTGVLIEVEPGRALHNQTGIHLTKVHVTKHETENIDRKWAETDTSEVFLSIGSLNVKPPFDFVVANKADMEPTTTSDIVGATCNYECLYEQVPVPELELGDVIALLNTGSYIEPYTCNFNALPRPGTVLVSGDRADLIKRHETVEEVFSRDIVPERLK
jgi:diaminopimelate decarboxylase